jgi:hypothetical protein
MSSFLKKPAPKRPIVVSVKSTPTHTNIVRASEETSPRLVFPEKYIPKKYETPDVCDMAIVIVFFNPTQSIRIMQNLCYVKSLLEAADIPTFYGELAFDTNPYMLPCASNTVQWRSPSYMFYKENLIVQLEKSIPPQYTKLCILDADIVFEESGWYTMLSKMLDSYTIVQPYSQAHMLDLTFQKNGVKQSCLKEKNGHSGFGWAFQRPWFQRNPFFEYALIGGGDSIFCQQMEVVDKISYAYMEDLNMLPLLEPYTKAFLDTQIYHLPHGNRANRQFMTRHEVLRKQIHAFGVRYVRDLTLRRDDGILVWKPEYMEIMNKLIIQYFKTRNDDGV